MQSTFAQHEVRRRLFSILSHALFVAKQNVHRMGRESQQMNYKMEGNMTECEFDLREENLDEWQRQTNTARGRRTAQSLGKPREIQRQNLIRVLVWVYHWGFSTADIISDLLGRKNRSHARRMEKDGWLCSVSIKGCPTYYTLTEKGLAVAENESPARKLLDYKEVDPYRVHIPTVNHELIAQTETLAALKHGYFEDYLTPRMYVFPKDSTPKKIPDVILVRYFRAALGNEMVAELTAVEIELTTKRGIKLDQFATNMLEDIGEQIFRRFLIVTDSKAVFKHYEAQLKPKNQIKLWDCTKIKPVDTGKVYIVPEWAPRFVLFREVGSNEPYDYK